MKGTVVHLVSFTEAKEVPLCSIPTGLTISVGGRLAHVVHLGGIATLRYDGAFVPPVQRPDDGRTFSSIRIGNSPGQSMKEE